MFRSRSRRIGLALIAILALGLAACSSTGGKAATNNTATGVAAGHANTPHYTFAMITHAAPGDTFWDIIRAGASAAAAKDNVTLNYSNNQDPTQQANLIQAAINSHVNGIAVTDPNPAAICPTIQKGHRHRVVHGPPARPGRVLRDRRQEGRRGRRGRRHRSSGRPRQHPALHDRDDHPRRAG